MASLKTSEHRWHLIDVLRGLSILSVILLHIDGRIPFAKSALGSHANIFRRWDRLASVDLKVFYKLRPVVAVC